MYYTYCYGSLEAVSETLSVQLVDDPVVALRRQKILPWLYVSVSSRIAELRRWQTSFEFLEEHPKNNIDTGKAGKKAQRVAEQCWKQEWQRYHLIKHEISVIVEHSYRLRGRLQILFAEAQG